MLGGWLFYFTFSLAKYQKTKKKQFPDLLPNRVIEKPCKHCLVNTADLAFYGCEYVLLIIAEIRRRDMMSDTGIPTSTPQLVQIAVTGLMDTQPLDHMESGSEQEEGMVKINTC